MTYGQIYDLIALLLSLTATLLVFFSAFRKLPIKTQERLDSINPFKPRTLKILGVIMFANVVSETLKLFNI